MKKIYIAGHTGMVGSSVYRRFIVDDNYKPIISCRKDGLDLRDQHSTIEFFDKEKPDIVVIAAAKVGGIMANNTYRADFLYDNLMIESNIIWAAQEFGVEKLLFLGSSCIYPKNCPQPIKEEYLLSDYLEFTNEPYAIAKIAGIKLCENYYRQYSSNFYSIMPPNLYGPYDNFNLEESHVLSALMRKFHESTDAVEIWGTGNPRREFMYVDDLADAIYFLINNVNAWDIYDQENITHLNVGTGTDIPIHELAHIIKDVVGFKGDLIYNSNKPDGTYRKLLDVSRMKNFGWEYSTSVEDGIKQTYNWYVNNINNLRT